MRRRQAFERLSAEENARRYAGFIEAAARRANPPPRAIGKGECPHCGKVFARGLHFHVKACGRVAA